ncbi:msl6009 [Mesorhizobium japonicum MAFF 303099]|uniref:Msl6009 protein n=1 Tax=Mesorhizobium japonicum (strain LMG 29417 / CECT 9101 / MAFF 303099) TaxID=266835 RepID=Q98AG5_RHILO|nr:msl6009 [Mesorhizobium japonicum MAFF 303099]
MRTETEVKSVRESQSKPDRGIVEFEHRAYNQNDVLVAKTIRQAMIRKRHA